MSRLGSGTPKDLPKKVPFPCHLPPSSSWDEFRSFSRPPSLSTTPSDYEGLGTAGRQEKLKESVYPSLESLEGDGTRFHLKDEISQSEEGGRKRIGQQGRDSEEEKEKKKEGREGVFVSPHPLIPEEQDPRGVKE